MLQQQEGVNCYEPARKSRKLILKPTEPKKDIYMKGWKRKLKKSDMKTQKP